MSFEKIKSFLKEINEVNIFYFKENRNLWVFISLLYFITFIIIPACLFDIEQYFNLLLITSCFVYVFILLTFMHLEHHKQKCGNYLFIKQINQLEIFKSFLKADNKVKGILSNLFKMFVFLIASIILIIISFMIKPLIMVSHLLLIFGWMLLIFGWMLFYISIFSFIYFLIDLKTLIKERSKN